MNETAKRTTFHHTTPAKLAEELQEIASLLESLPPQYTLDRALRCGLFVAYCNGERIHTGDLSPRNVVFQIRYHMQNSR